jgi:4-hydroxy-tetrahydrodipicolinate reductase
MNTNIVINGFFGRMGQAILEQSLNIAHVNIVAGRDINTNSKENSQVEVTNSLNKIKSSFDVVIDFSLAAATIDVVTECVELNKPVVIGTTGHNSSQLSNIEKLSSSIPILLAPNMSIGVNTTLSAIREIARALQTYNVHITETHHKDKIDSPSGTALKIANVICDARGKTLGNISDDNCPIKFTSIRKDVAIGTHEVIFRGEKDSVTIIHIADDRSIFARGSIDTAVWLSSQNPGFYSYNDYMKSMS